MRAGTPSAPGPVKGRHVSALSEDLSAARNRKVEAITLMLDKSSKTERRGPKGSTEDSGTLIDALTVDLNGVDMSIRKAQERSHEFAQEVEKRFVNKQAAAARWEPFRPLSCGPTPTGAAGGPKPPATPRPGTSAGGGGGLGGGSGLAAFGGMHAQAAETAQHEPRKPSKGRALAGPKLKALRALEECPYVANVHNIVEVQQIPCGTARVDTKVDYYREHDLAAGPLMEQVERRFMIYKAEAGESLVNVPRLGQMAVGAAAIRHHFAEPRTGASSARSHRSERDSRTSMRTGSPSSPRRSPSPRCHQLLPAFEEHTARSERAAVSARQQQMDQRVEHLRLFQQRQMRHERATRARPWLTWLVAAIAMEKMAELWLAYVAELKHATFQIGRPIYTSEESWNKARRKLRIVRSVAKSMGAIQDVPRFKLIKAKESATIKRMATQKGLEFAETRRKDKLWRLWMHAVRVAIFAVRVRSPLRKHMQMEIAKKFINSAWKGYRVIKTMQAFVRRVTLIRLAMKQTLALTTIVKRHIILPQVWIVETMALGEAVGLSHDCLSAAVADFEEAMQIEQWRWEALRLMQSREDIILGKAHVKCAITFAQQPGGGGGKKHGETPHLSASKVERRQSRVFFTGAAGHPHEQRHGGVKHHGSVMAIRCDVEPDVAHARVGTAPSTPKERPPSTPKEHRRAAEKGQPEKAHQTHVIEVPGGGWQVDNSTVRCVDEYRLGQEERELIAAQIWRENLERWWQVYKLYKDACKVGAVRWRQWRQEASRLGPGHRELWPLQPSVQQFPSELMEVHTDALRQRVVGHLRQGRAAAIL